MNQDADLIRMANQITEAFALYPEAEATAGIATHIREFWDPRMRQRLSSLAAQAQASFAPRALQAIAMVGGVHPGPRPADEPAK